MPEYYTSIAMKDAYFRNYHTDSGEELESLNGLSRVNIFVGQNNSGKSRLMRGLANMERHSYSLSGIDLGEVRKSIAVIEQKFAEVLNKHNGLQSFKVDSQKPIQDTDLKQLGKVVGDYWDESTHGAVRQIVSILDQLEGADFRVHETRRGGYIEMNVFREEIQQVLGQLTTEIKVITAAVHKTPFSNRVYIPVLRSLNYFDICRSPETPHKNMSVTDIYRQRVYKSYGLKENLVDVFTGMNLYAEIMGMKLGGKEQRDQIADFERFLGEELFDGESVELLTKLKDDVLHVKIGGREERPIFDLGDGIQSLILYTFPLFKHKRSLIFIEEPETHLHPGMQRKLIELFQKYSNHQYFITTHSNHLLDLTNDYEGSGTTIFSVSRPSKDDDYFKVRLASSADHPTLRALGVQNSSVFLSNCTIWVEGITDRLYLRKYLELFVIASGSSRIHEDIDYSFVEYGGSNITHWSFLDDSEDGIDTDRLCGRLLLIADQDNGKQAKRHEKLLETLGDRFYVLPVREVENLLSPTALWSVVGEYEKDSALGVPPFAQSKYKKKYLGTFLDKTLDKLRDSHRTYAEDSGTLKLKTSFCNKALKYITWETMSADAKSLAERMYDFVISNQQQR